MTGNDSVRPGQALQALAGVLVLLLASFLLYKQVLALKNAGAALEREKAARQKALQTLQSLKEAEKQLPYLEDRLEKYGRMLPAKPDEKGLIAGLNMCADESGVDLRQIHFGNRVKKDGYTEMPVDLVLEGRYRDILAFLLAIREDGRRIVRVDSVKMGRGQEDQTLVRAEVGARAFYSESK
ncbi:MAG: type 4a pilus biogenesis protein PilO [Firmicutes bacterium]|nr:type 4a pilus biogenesis protein PilO [Bacillota bacterium]